MKNKYLCVLCHFRRQFKTFFTLKTVINRSEKSTAPQMLSLLTLFNIPIHEIVQKIDEIANNFETWKSLDFVVFSVSVSDIFQLKMRAIISSEKTTGQRIRTTLIAFNILYIYSIYMITYVQWDPAKRNPAKE